ncbi:MAG TPA: hypothetical protein DCQ06_09720 [Myxococcales bacterium]|nr:hypothetical protein [Myxococcales bacterium]
MSIRSVIAICVTLVFTLGCGPTLGTGQLNVDQLDRYPQNSPYSTLRSINKALDDGRYDYLVAHLADQEALDKMTMSQVQRAVRDTKTRFSGSGDEFGALLRPQLKAALRACQLLCPDGQPAKECMGIQGQSATCILKDGAKLTFSKSDDRWFMKD